jgi:hypothetical protein
MRPKEVEAVIEPQVRDKVVSLGPGACGLARTSTVQLAPPGSVEAEHELDMISKSVELLRVGLEQPRAETELELIRVKLLVGEVLPTLTLPKLCVRGDQAREDPAPLTMIWFGVVVALPPTAQVRDKVALLMPADSGLARTSTVQLSPAPKEEDEQVDALISKSA